MPTEPEEIPKPQGKRRISTFEILSGKIISPLERMAHMSADDFEEMILEWADGYLAAQYEKIRQFGGAGDKGRDIVGYYSDKSVDIYQCKHYADKITPTDIYKELAKICWYTFNNDFPIPKSYYIVSPKGLGSKLLDMVNAPAGINQLLADNWVKYCQDEITSKTSILLEGGLKSHVENFDFSIVKDIAPHELIAQHMQTRYHVLRFGGGLKKYREVIPKAAEEIQPKELIYTSQLFEVYGEKCGQAIANMQELEKKDAELYSHFTEQRKSFYCAETLESFSRENFPDADPLPFDEFKDEAYNIAVSNLVANSDKTGFERLIGVTRDVKLQSFSSNPLHQEIKVQDKEGVCHHLANENKLNWIKKK